ncbi:nucleoside monophosphate kinase [Candidatus Woesearchaeota archaeon]|nr:nucleoside monophosphate kinase [Candidatus Woesearchaeota archaeon]
MNLVFIAMPAAGKGTYAQILCEELGIPHLSTGELIRELAAAGDKLGKEAIEYNNRGVYAPDELVIKIWEKRLHQPDARNGAIMDNFPGNVSQAKAIEGRIKVDRVLFFDAPEDVRIYRITGRLTCRKCGQIYHEVEVKPKKKGVCDLCGGELYKREDQQLDVVKKRFDTYEKEITPLVEFYSKKGLLRVIDSSKSIRVAREEIMGNIHKAIEDLK